MRAYYAWHVFCFRCARFKSQGPSDTIGKALWTGRARPGLGTGGDELADQIGLRTAAHARLAHRADRSMNNKQESK
jgi:hypothetical protein